MEEETLADQSKIPELIARIWYFEGHPPQGLSEARRDKVVVKIFLLLIRRGGVPSGAAAFIINGILGKHSIAFALQIFQDRIGIHYHWCFWKKS